MTREVKKNIRAIFYSIVWWSLAAAISSFLRYGVSRYGVRGSADEIDLLYLVSSAALIGICFGAVFGLLDLILDTPRFRRKPFGFMLVLQGIVHMGIIFVFLCAITYYDQLRVDGVFSSDIFFEVVLSRSLVVLMLNVGLISFMYNFLKQINLKFGPGNLKKLILGTYYHPKEEELIFMFLDMKDSTTHAEKLGHLKFSQLIQSCFQDLSVVALHEANIYQYVGDEAILCWDTKRGAQENNCINCYFAFIDQLHKRHDFYLSTFGIMPEFKAGIHMGPAIVAEVGDIKREISYLGDTVNTAARIQGQCNELQNSFLISAEIKNILPPHTLYDYTHLGDIALKGKNDVVELFGVSRQGLGH